jgi:hypothetical protein
MVSSSSAARGVCLGRRTDNRINRNRYRRKQHQHWPRDNQQQLSHNRLAEHSNRRQRGNNSGNNPRQHSGTIHHHQSKRNFDRHQSERHWLDSWTEQHGHKQQLDRTRKR